MNQNNIIEFEKIWSCWESYNLPVYYSTATVKDSSKESYVVRLVNIDFYPTSQYHVSPSVKPITKIIE